MMAKRANNRDSKLKARRKVIHRDPKHPKDPKGMMKKETLTYKGGKGM